MKSIISKIVVWVCILSLMLPYATLTSSSENEGESIEEKEYIEVSLDQDFVDNHVIVVMKKQNSEVNNEVDPQIFSSIDYSKINDLTHLSKYEKGHMEDCAMLNESDFHQILLVELPTHSKENVIRTIEEISALKEVKYAGPDYELYPASNTPGDPFLSDQWGLETIHAFDAWDIKTGSSTVCVGVLDSGIASHADLNSNVTSGYDFVNDNSTTTDDITGHGTHVAGIIGAVGDNETGVAGVCWNIRIVPLQITYNAAGNAHTSTVISAISYATDNNIPILNFSYWNFPNDASLKHVIANYKGLFVCIAGNNGDDIEETPNYPASFKLENTIVVANTTSSDVLASNSNYGASSVDLAAPGTSILSCYPTALCAAGTHGYGHYANGYHSLSGTSMAAPHVSGVAALIKSIRPDLSATEIKALILNNVDQIGALSGKCVTGGRLNAYKAVRAATEPQTFTGDVNGDGRADIIMSRKINGKRAITTYLGKSDGKFTEPITTTSTRTFIYSDPAFVGDFNGDGKTDFLIHWSTAGYRQLLVYKSNGDGTFSEGQNLNSTRVHNPISLPCSFHVGDVNGDGKDDFIVHYRDWNGHRCALVYKGRTTAPYVYDATTTALTSTNMYRSNDPVYVGDFNGDGRDDMVVHWATNGFRQLLVYTANSDASFNSGANLYSSRAYNPSVNPSKNFIADVNGDGKDDFVVHWKNTTGYRNNLVYKGKSASPYFFDATTDALNSGNHYVLTDPVFVGDTTGDGRTDMIVHWTNYEGKRQLLTYKAKSDGTYNLGNNYPTDNANDPYVYAERYFVDDVDGDGKDDFIVKWKNSSGMVRFYTYRGKSDASFQAAAKTTPSINVPYYN